MGDPNGIRTHWAEWIWVLLRLIDRRVYTAPICCVSQALRVSNLPSRSQKISLKQSYYRSVTFKLVAFRSLLPVLYKIGTRNFQRFVVEHFPSQPVQELREIIDLIHSTSVDIFEMKKRALKEGDEAVERQVARGKDIMSILRRFI